MQKKMWNSYPRPQMVKEKFHILNGVWKLNGKDILVPFPPQSDLSGYNYKEEENFEYELSFSIPIDFTEERILLHFGAVDQIAEVFVNGSKVGSHKGGYIPFYFDITKYVNKDDDNILMVKVTDTLDTNLPYGKQCKKRGGMWYTPVSGIWQSVWLENVPSNYVERVRITPKNDVVKLELEGYEGNFSVEVYTEPVKDNFDEIYFDNSYKIQSKTRFEFCGNAGKITIYGGKRWTPDEPYLYIADVITEKEKFKIYFALRDIAIKSIDGVNKVCLNDRPIFMHGVLDQGYFMKGIFLPENETDYDTDILNMKELGFNMLRKHIKVEPEYFYYACDRLGMLVVQDMVNNGKYSFLKDTAMPTIGLKHKSDKVKPKKKIQKEIFKNHMKQTVSHLYNHPSIVTYTIFNEGWGQVDSDEMYDTVKNMDGIRLIDSTSGWFAGKKSDFDSEHIYFRIKQLKPKKRPLFLSECGGYQMTTEGHLFSDKEYGYGKCKSKEELTGRIKEMYEKMVIPGIKNGICGCVYTQLSDVEEEINGLYTYDREVCKVDKDLMKNIAEKIYKTQNKEE